MLKVTIFNTSVSVIYKRDIKYDEEQGQWKEEEDILCSVMKLCQYDVTTFTVMNISVNNIKTTTYSKYYNKSNTEIANIHTHIQTNTTKNYNFYRTLLEKTIKTCYKRQLFVEI